MPQDVIEVHDLFELIFNNAFPRLRLCTALGVVPLTASVTWSLSPSLRFLYVPMKTAEDYERLPYICPNLQLFPSCKNRFVDPLNRKTSFVFLLIKYDKNRFRNSWDSTQTSSTAYLD